MDIEQKIKDENVNNTKAYISIFDKINELYEMYYHHQGKPPNELHLERCDSILFVNMINKHYFYNANKLSGPLGNMKHCYFMGMRIFHNIFTSTFVNWTENTEILIADIDSMTKTKIRIEPYPDRIPVEFL
jgi:hypothetical protein